MQSEAHGLALFILDYLHACARLRVCHRAHMCALCVCVLVCVTVFLHSWVGWFLHGGSVCTPLTPGCHCAAVMINHVVQRLALFRREGTNHTPHYPGLVTLKQCSPWDTSACCCLDGERKKNKCVCTSLGIFFVQNINMGCILINSWQLMN